MNLKYRKSLDLIPPYKLARNLEAAKRELGVEKIIKLAGNENTLGFSPTVFDALKDATSFYPDGSALALRERISQKYGVPLERIVAGNGSFELIFLAALALLESGDETVGARPSFGWYESSTKILGGKFVGVPVKKDFSLDLDAMAAAVGERTKIVWLCNPNNPTGTVFGRTELDSFLKKIPESVLVVLDEAYIDFVESPDFPNSVELMETHENLFILRTFSKLEGLAGFRVGYGFAREDFISLLNKIRLPCNVSGASQLAALAAIEDGEFNRRTLENARAQKKVLYEFFESHGLPFVRSHTNFVFFDTLRDSSPVVEALASRGILVRAGAEYGFPTMIRLSVGSAEETRAVVDALSEILGGRNIERKGV